MEKIETLIIGAGQAGLSTSYLLKQAGREHLVLEKAGKPGHIWADSRWDSFALLTPNWTVQLPGGKYAGSYPDGFLLKDEISLYFERYANVHNLPIRYQVCASAVEALPGGGYRVETDRGEFEAVNVVIATGLFQGPKSPAFASSLPGSITQLHSGSYRNPGQLPPGAVLVVGSGQSGCQIAEELYQSGRSVHLSVGSAGRAPRRYRGKDVFEWLLLAGFFDRTVDKLPSPRAKFAGNPHLSGRDGGHSLNLHTFAREGVHLVGRVAGAQGGRLELLPNLNENLAKADKFEADLVKIIDEYILKNGLDNAPQELPQLRDGFVTDEPRELDLRAENITSIIWAGGYTFDFGLVKLPVTDGDGYPIQQRGVTRFPGLYFIGMPWLSKYKSGLLVGVGEDAEYIAARICDR